MITNSKVSEQSQNIIFNLSDDVKSQSDPEFKTNVNSDALNLNTKFGNFFFFVDQIFCHLFFIILKYLFLKIIYNYKACFNILNY